MDFDGEYVWQAMEADVVLRFIPEGTSATYHISTLPFLISGLCVFPYGDDLGILLTIYHLKDATSELNFYAYVFDGDEVKHLCCVGIPEDAYKSLRLVYNENRGSFYWSYIDSGYTPYIVEFDLDFGGSLSQSTWVPSRQGWFCIKHPGY